jgi:1,4-dihydroxy-2-naphthoate polyprenyltransferase
VAPVIAASALAVQDGVFVLPAAAACLTFALLVQIGTNFANDYFDFVKGADTAERVGPRRAVAAGLVAPKTMRSATAVVFILAFAVGLTLLNYGGWPLLIIGLASIACGVAYTGGPYPLAYHGLGDVFVFVFFGLVAVAATYFVQAGHVTREAWIVGVGIGALATNILVVNNYRDIATDRKAGKRTLAVRFGPQFTRGQFIGGHTAAILALLLLVRAGRLATWEAAVLAAGAGVVALRQARVLTAARTAPELIALLGATGRYLALYAFALGAALVF